MFDNLIKEFIKLSDKRSFKNKEKAFFFKELWNLLKWGININEALGIIAENHDNYSIKKIALWLKRHIEQWDRLSRALLNFPKQFDTTDITTIQAWESSGNLDVVLEMIGKEYAYLESLKKKFIGALTYPIILITVAFWAIIALFTFILPAIFDIANQFDTSELPRTTRTLKWFSEYLATHHISLLAIVLFIGFWLFVYFSTKSGKKKWFQLLFSIPILGKMIKSYYLIRFARYVKLLLGSGLDYLTLFKIVKNVIPNPVFTPLFDKIIHELNRWSTIHNALKDDTNLIPGNVVSLIKVWEESATLDRSFETIIEIYQEELDHYINNLSKLIEPILLLFIGWIVIMVALGVFWVIMKIMDSVTV